MYAGGSIKRMNYYVPVQQDDTPARKKKKCDKDLSRAEAPRAARILSRRYALTSTSYKYLDVGISVGTVSCVELMLGDNRGNRIVLPIATWRGLIEKRVEIERLIQSTEPATLWIRDLAVEILQLRDTNIVKLTLVTDALYFKPATMIFLLDLESCVDLMYYWLCDNTHLVNAKFKDFVTVLREQNIIDAENAVKTIRESNVFDSESLIDCELLAYGLNNILYDATNY